MIKIPNSQYLQLTTELAAAILDDAALDDIWIIGDNGDITYTEEAQDRFNEIIDMVDSIMWSNSITSEDA